MDKLIGQRVLQTENVGGLIWVQRESVLELMPRLAQTPPAPVAEETRAVGRREFLISAAAFLVTGVWQVGQNVLGNVVDRRFVQPLENAVRKGSSRQMAAL